MAEFDLSRAGNIFDTMVANRQASANEGANQSAQLQAKALIGQRDNNAAQMLANSNNQAAGDRAALARNLMTTNFAQNFPGATGTTGATQQLGTAEDVKNFVDIAQGTNQLSMAGQEPTKDSVIKTPMDNLFLPRIQGDRAGTAAAKAAHEAGAKNTAGSETTGKYVTLKDGTRVQIGPETVKNTAGSELSSKIKGTPLAESISKEQIFDVRNRLRGRGLTVIDRKTGNEAVDFSDAIDDDTNIWVKDADGNIGTVPSQQLFTFNMSDSEGTQPRTPNAMPPTKPMQGMFDIEALTRALVSPELSAPTGLEGILVPPPNR